MNRALLLFIAIILLASCLRLFHLDQIPSGFIPEEISTGWNAYSLLKTGRDEWGVLLPIIFRETGGFKLALNSYLIVPLMALFGATEFSVRLSVAIAGILSAILTFVLTRRIFAKTSVALAASFLLAISPWHISMNRYSVDVNWGIPLFLGGIILFLHGRNRPVFLIGSGILFALTYYTYFNYVVFTFLFLLGLLWVYKDLWKEKKGRIFLAVFILIQLIAMLPYITQQNLTVRFSQATSVGNIGLVNRIHEHREACGKQYPYLLCSFLYNRPSTTALEIARRYVNHYSTTTFFLYGSTLGLSGMPDRWGYLYLFEFPLLLLGFTAMIRNRTFPSFIVLWLFLYGIPSSLASEAHIWRMMTILPLPHMIEGVGLISLVSWIQSFVYTRHNRILRGLYATRMSVLSVGIIGIVSLFLLRFITDYTTYFPYFQGRFSYFGFRDLYRHLATIEDHYNRIIVTAPYMGFDQLYIYYLFYMKPDPRKYQLGVDVDRSVGEQNWVYVSRIGKWHFVKNIEESPNIITAKTLLVSDDKHTVESLKDLRIPSQLIKTVYRANGDAAFRIFSISPQTQITR